MLTVRLAANVLRILCAAPLLALAQPQQPSGGWIPLFDGKTLNQWKQTPFIDRGDVKVRDGVILLEKGHTTGINWTGDFPRSDYEIRFEAARIEGRDFFAGITFPVGKAHCSWVSGGWDGSVVGLSNLDGNDASENDSSTVMQFATGRWYAFRLSVSSRRIQAWIDGKLVIDIDITTRELSLPFGESDLSAPLGFSSYKTTAGLRNIEYRKLESSPAR